MINKFKSELKIRNAFVAMRFQIPCSYHLIYLYINKIKLFERKFILIFNLFIYII